MKITAKLYAEFHPTFQAIAAKFTNDRSLAEDCVQEVWAEILALPQNRYRKATNKSAYLRMVAKHTVLSKLASYNTGSWYVGRRVALRDGDKLRYENRRARYVQIDHFLTAELLQIDTHGTVLPGERADADAYYYTRQLDYGGMTALIPL